VKKFVKTSMVLPTALDEIPDVCSSCFKVTLTNLDSRSRNQVGGSTGHFPFPKFSKTFSIVGYNIKL